MVTLQQNNMTFENFLIYTWVSEKQTTTMHFDLHRYMQNVAYTYKG